MEGMELGSLVEEKVTREDVSSSVAVPISTFTGGPATLLCRAKADLGATAPPQVQLKTLHAPTQLQVLPFDPLQQRVVDLVDYKSGRYLDQRHEGGAQKIPDFKEIRRIRSLRRCATCCLQASGRLHRTTNLSTAKLADRKRNSHSLASGVHLGEG